MSGGFRYLLLTTSLIAAISSCSLPLWAQAPAQAELEQFLGKISSDNGDVRREAFEDAKRYGAAAVVPLGPFLFGENRSVARAAQLSIEAIVAHAGRPDAGPECAAVGRALVELMGQPGPPTTHAFVIRQLALVGSDEAVPALARLLDDEALREDARQALHRIPGDAATQALIAALPKADPDFRAGIIFALGNRQETAAVPELLGLATAANMTVRLAALDALGRIADPRAADVLLKAAQEGPPEQREVAAEAYLRLADGTPAIESPTAALHMYEQALSAAQTTAQRIAAMLGIERLGDEKSIPAVLAGLGDPNPLFQHVAIGFVEKHAGDRAMALMTEALKTAQPRAKGGILVALAARNAPNVNVLLMESLEDRNDEVQAAAATGLGLTLHQPAAPQLLGLAEQEGDAVKTPALNSYLRLLDAQVAAGAAPNVIGYTRALELAARDDERNIALGGLAKAADATMLALVEPWTEREGTKAAALATYLAVGKALAAGNQNAQAERVFRNVIARGAARDQMNAAAEGLRALGIEVDLAHEAGFITQWWLLGPIRDPDGKAFDAKMPPEEAVDLTKPAQIGDQALQWQANHTTDIEGVLNFIPLFNPNQRTAVYAYSEVTVPAAKDVTFRIGSDDGVKVFLNGQETHANNASRPVRVDQDRKDAQLSAGLNRILVKVTQGGGDWGLCVRLTERNGQPLQFQQRKAE